MSDSEEQMRGLQDDLMMCRSKLARLEQAATFTRPVSHQTVDIAVINRQHSSASVVLGQKTGAAHWRFIGGFVDPTDQSLEGAARREVKEETGLSLPNLTYIGSTQIDDPRYRWPDRIMTAFFVSIMPPGRLTPGDDIAKARWIDNDMLGFLITAEHMPLVTMLRTYLGGKG